MIVNQTKPNQHQSNNMERKEYLQRPLIEGVVYEITNSKVRISSPHTVFLSADRQTVIPLPEVERLFRELKKEAKDSGKIRFKGVSKFLPTVRTFYPSYQEAVQQMNYLFSEITEIARKIKADGLHRGCSDDVLLEEALSKEKKIMMYYHHNTDFSRYSEQYQHIKEILSAKCWKNESLVSAVIRFVQ